MVRRVFAETLNDLREMSSLELFRVVLCVGLWIVLRAHRRKLCRGRLAMGLCTVAVNG